jgi:hypothetical protein
LIIVRRVTDDAGESVGIWGMSDPFFLLRERDNQPRTGRGDADGANIIREAGADTNPFFYIAMGAIG